jgi:hypothetical protein
MFVCPMITVAGGKRLLPYVWSPCWWVLTAIRTGTPVAGVAAGYIDSFRGP